MDNILITGGAGFIGSHVAELVAQEYPDSRIVILDKMTYAADENNLADVLDGGRRSLKQGDICDFELCTALTRGIDTIIHMAAESHVDNAFGNSLEFTRSNTLGTHTLLEAARLNEVPFVRPRQHRRGIWGNPRRCLRRKKYAQSVEPLIPGPRRAPR